MSIVSVSNRWLNRLYKILAIIVVSLAVLISAFRLFLPYVENYRIDFQHYINTSYQTNIVIGGLGMSWQRSGPTLIADRVTLVDTNGAYIYVKHLEVEVDFWASITSQRLISNNLLLDGATVALEQNVLQSPEIQTAAPESDTLELLKQISVIFLNRINRFSLVNSEISIENNTQDHHFSVNNLNWLNDNNRHQAQGSIIVDELSSNNLSLKIDMKGHSIDELNGVLYLEANHIDITPWLDSVLSVDNDKTKADIGFSAWLKIVQGGVERLQVSLHENIISWEKSTNHQAQDVPDENLKHSQVTPLNENTAEENGIIDTNHLRLSEGQLLLVKGKELDSFTLYSTPLTLKFNDSIVEEFTVQLDKTSEDYSVYLSSFDMALISKISPLLISDQNSREFFSGLDVKGIANDLFFKKSADDIKAVAHFSNVSSEYSQGVPGVDNLSGSLSFTEQFLHLDLDAKQGHLDFKGHFVTPIPYSSLQGTAALTLLEKSWQLDIKDIELTSEDLSLNANLSINAPEKGEKSMSLLANIINGDVSKAGHYYPLAIMSEKLVGYLNSALIKGDMVQAQVLINGDLDKFPFVDNSGTFIVDGEIENTTFQFSEDWPVINNLSANLNFHNNSMLITGRSGSLNDLPVGGVQVAIEDLLKEQVLTVDTFILPSSATKVADLMNQSPFEHTIGSTLEQVVIQGDINGEFHLKLPLNSVENALAIGSINFVDNEVSLKTPTMNFQNVSGALYFENDKIESEELTVNWQGLPITLDINGSKKSKRYDTNIKLQADWKNDLWLAHIPTKLKKYFEGQLAFNGNLALHQHDITGLSYQLNIDSNLDDVKINFPLPFKKTRQTKEPISIEVKGEGGQSIFTAKYAEQLRFYGVLDHKTSHFSRAHVILGNEKMLLPIDGFHITSNLAKANIHEWQPFITDIIDTTSIDEQAINKSLPLFSKPERIRGMVNELEFLGQKLHNVSFNILDKKNWLLLQLNAKEASGQLKFYPDWLSQGVDVNADFIHLISQEKNITVDKENNVEAEDEEKNVDLSLENQSIFASIPKMNFSCERCQIDNLNLGKVDFSVERTGDNSIKIKHFEAQREQARLKLSGEWRKKEKDSLTTIAGSLSLKNIEFELEQLGYASIVRDSGGFLEFDLNWLGGPHNFDFKDLNGNLKAKLDDGYLAEVSDKARIFSVLSLQSIVRKLTFDFRDIFSDGMFYKNIKGDYLVNQGVLYTENTRMNGSAGDLYITGNTNFIDNMLDYKMSYKPNLTSSLPVLAWIATLNPVVFLAGVAIDQVITSKVVSEFNFELTGNVNNPNFKEVNRKSRDVSVGRSKPPEFVDGSNKTNDLRQEELKKKSFKEFESSTSSEYDPIISKYESTEK